jgi:hypothetical protein
MENDSNGARRVIISSNSNALFLPPARVRAYGEATELKDGLDLTKNRYKI